MQPVLELVCRIKHRSQTKIRKIFDDYVHAWGDWIAVAVLYPCSQHNHARGRVDTLLSSQGRKNCKSSFREWVTRIIGRLILGRAAITGLRTQSIGARSVLATLNWQMVRTVGSIVREWRQSYNLVRIDARWQILVATLRLE